MTFGSHFASPERGLTVLIAGQIAFWTLAPALSLTAPPLDVVEMYVWGREGVLATFKHPNLPGLMLEGLRRLTGQVGWPAYLLAQVCIGVTFWAVFALGRELMDAARALAGAVALTGIYFFFWVTPEFNHNVLQMPFWALTVLALWRATTRGHWLAWLLLGVFAGLGIWAKYSFAMMLLVAAAWMLWDGAARKRLMSPGPWLALAVFAAIIAPQIWWLTDNNFFPFEYAARRASGGGPLNALEFLATEALNHLPMVLMLASAGFFGAAAMQAPAQPGQRAMHFLLFMGLGPLAVFFIAGVFGMGLRAAWGAPIFSLSGLLVIALLASRFSAERLKRLAIGAGLMIGLGTALYFAHLRVGAQITNEPLKGNWPQSDISRALEAAWVNETHAPLEIVAGDIWTAGQVGLDSHNPPSVLIDGDFSISPWVNHERAARQGMLLVWRGDAAPAGVQALGRDLPAQTIEFSYPQFPNASPLQLHYTILPPGD